MNDEQLLEFDEQQARQQLNDEQLERYNELKKQELEGAIEEKKEKDNEARAEGLKTLREDKEKELTVDVNGLNFLADINDEQARKLHKLKKYRDKSEEDLSSEQVKEIKDDLITVLSQLNQDYNENEWRNEFGDAGVFTIASLAYDVVDEINDFTDQKKRRFNNGQGRTGRTS